MAANSIDAVHSISRNIAKGYCQRSLKEYLNYLNIALGFCCEFHFFKRSKIPAIGAAHWIQFVAIPTFQYSMWQHLDCAVKNHMISINCRISETFNYGVDLPFSLALYGSCRPDNSLSRASSRSMTNWIFRVVASPGRIPFNRSTSSAV